MSTRRPVASPRSSALPTLVALLAAGISVEGCLTDAHAQTPPRRDAGVQPQPPTRPPEPPIPPAGGIPPAHPYQPPTPPQPPTTQRPPTPPQPPTTQRPDTPVAVPGGIGKVSAG